MAFQFINYTKSGLSSGNTVTINKPTNTSDNDIMFAFIITNTIIISNVPSGWNLISLISPGNGNYHYYLYYKIASSEGSNYKFDFNGTNSFSISISTFRDGFSLLNPILSYSAIDSYSSIGGTTINRAASFNVSKINSPLIFFGGSHSTSSVVQTPPTIPTTFTEHFDVGSTSEDKWQEVASCIWSSSGDTGNIDSTMSQSRFNQQAFCVALDNGVSEGSFSFFPFF